MQAGYLHLRSMKQAILLLAVAGFFVLSRYRGLVQT